MGRKRVTCENRPNKQQNQGYSNMFSKQGIKEQLFVQFV